MYVVDTYKSVIFFFPRENLPTYTRAPDHLHRSAR